MSKNTISTFSLILLIGAVMWFFHMNREAERRAASELQEIEQQDVVEVMPRPTPRATATRSVSPRAAQVSGELQTLEQQLATAQATLQAQRESVQELRARNQAMAVRAPASDNTINVMRSESQMQNALMEIDSYRNLEQQINKQAEDQIRIQNSAAQTQMTQMEENIRVQENLIRQTREDITYWTYNFNDQTRQISELQRLNALLVSQNQQLELMLQQRLLISAEALSNAQAIQATKLETLSGVQSDQIAAQGDVESLRDSIIRLQQSQREIRDTQVSLGSQLRQAQQSLQNQEAQVRSLETAIEQKRQELDSLVQ